MKAVVYDRYGPPEVLRLEEVERPTPGKGEVLLEVESVSLNLSDWEALRGTPLYARVFGLFRPRHRILGSDIAGTVEALGPGVTQFAVGDAVFGDALGTFGGFAEYACVPAGILMKKPEQLSFDEVAAVPQASMIAMQGLCVGGALQPGQRVLINGAGGGSGMFAIQIAKLMGAEVIAVDHGEKLDHMRSLGADHVLDYRKVAFTELGERYALVLDLVNLRSPFANRRALEKGGSYAMVGGSMSALLQTLLLGPLVSAVSGTRLKLLAVQAKRQDLVTILEWMVTGRLKVTVDQRFPLERAAEALRYVGEGRARGKVLVVPGLGKKV
jgi:NADPH:quinone reductase-like Zn-dependent oxidoreductase